MAPAVSTFSEIVGQQAIIAELKRILHEKRAGIAGGPSAVILCGASGTGKTALYRLFYYAAHCSNPLPDGSPCFRCERCEQSGLDAHFYEIDCPRTTPDEIDTLLDAIRTSSPHLRVYGFDEAHALPPAVQAALLKSMQDAARNVLFFFMSTDLDGIDTAIQDRCRILSVARVSMPGLILLQERILASEQRGGDPDALEEIAVYANGSARKVEQTIRQCLLVGDGPVTLAHVHRTMLIPSRDLLMRLVLSILPEADIESVTEEAGRAASPQLLSRWMQVFLGKLISYRHGRRSFEVHELEMFAKVDTQLGGSLFTAADELAQVFAGVNMHALPLQLYSVRHRVFGAGQAEDSDLKSSGS